MFLVAATRANPNCFAILEFLFQKIRILKSYLGAKFDDDSLKSNFTLVYELFDETMDYGFAQNCAIDVLKLYIQMGEATFFSATGPSQTTGSALTSQITGAIDWRREGIRYRKNEVFIDVFETCSLLMSAAGKLLRAEVQGKVMMKAQLTGMPECKFGLNDRLIMEKETSADDAQARKAMGVEIDDCTFHRCVRLGKFDAERTITFIPPDGEFELMRYRVTESSQPFKLIPTINEEGKNKMIVHLKLHADFQDDKKATNVCIKIPMPPTAASAKTNVTKGRARYEPGSSALVWRIANLPGGSEISLSAEVSLINATKTKAWVKPPITMDFQIAMHTCSGVQVRFLKVYEKSGYQTSRWVKYLSQAGDYEMRLAS
jgi:AP-2 complex subunit mu-1